MMTFRWVLGAVLAFGVLALLGPVGLGGCTARLGEQRMQTGPEVADQGGGGALDAPQLEETDAGAIEVADDDADSGGLDGATGAFDVTPEDAIDDEETSAGDAAMDAAEPEDSVGDAPVDSASDTAVDGAIDLGPEIPAGVEPSVGCESGAGLSEEDQVFQLDGLERRFAVRLPTGYGTSSKAWPVVLALHGNGGHLGTWDADTPPYDLGAALEDDAIMVLVEAIDGKWRDYDMPSTYEERIELELSYFDVVLTELRQELCVDTSAIFSMGFSGGGSFSGLLGCRRTDIRGIASGGAVVYFDPEDCVGAPAAWVAISEGDWGPGREAFRNYFRDSAGCQETGVDTTPAGCVTYEGCAASMPVSYCEHPGGHIWPEFGNEAVRAFFADVMSLP